MNISRACSRTAQRCSTASSLSIRPSRAISAVWRTVGGGDRESRKVASSAPCELRNRSASVRDETRSIGSKLSHRYARNFSQSSFCHKQHTLWRIDAIGNKCLNCSTRKPSILEARYFIIHLETGELYGSDKRLDACTFIWHLPRALPLHSVAG